jgi:ABC-type multidrug transport system fused ATPase/permease subunit
LFDSPLTRDEATASVDLHTDMLIQKMVRKHFKNNTVITIAHRLATIMDSSKIMALEKGRVIEFDTPANLLEANGLVKSMVMNSC